MGTINKKEIVITKRIEQEIQELTEKINVIVENYKSVGNPLIESSQEVPKATKQLDKISKQTEDAAHRMLDTIEQVTQREDEVIEGLEKMKVLADGNDEISVLTESLMTKVSQNCNDIFTIMDALQFQDITAQQLNHAVVLLEELEQKLHTILKGLHGDTDQITTSTLATKKKRAYDPQADLHEKLTEQEAIDSLFEGKKTESKSG